MSGLVQHSIKTWGFVLILILAACNPGHDNGGVEPSPPGPTGVHLVAPSLTPPWISTPTLETTTPTLTPEPLPTQRDTSVPLFECISYDPTALQIVDLGEEGWELAFGYIRIALLDNAADAHSALELAKQHTQKCTVGKEFSDQYYMQYWQGESNISGEERDWDCQTYDPESLRINYTPERWIIMDSEDQKLQSFGAEIAAEMGLEIAQKYSKVCFIGRGNERVNRWDYIVSYWK